MGLIQKALDNLNNLTLFDPGKGGADLPPSSLIKEKNLFFKQLYLANLVIEIPKLGHYRKLFGET